MSWDPVSPENVDAATASQAIARLYEYTPGFIMNREAVC